MVQQSITLCGKDVHLAYCYATEISFKLLAEEDIHAFMQQAGQLATQGIVPDVRKSFYLILAAASAYYEAKGEEMPITDKDLMNDCDPQDFGSALKAVVEMYAEFYKVSIEEAKRLTKAKEGSKGKN